MTEADEQHVATLVDAEIIADRVDLEISERRS